MDEALIGKVMLWLVGIGGGLWSLYQLFRAVWGLKADADAVKALDSKLSEVRDGLHKLRGSTVSRDDIAARKLEVDKLLEDRRQDVIQLHQKIDGTETGLREEMRDLRQSMDTKLDRITNILIQTRQ